MNKVILTGNLTRALELRHLPGGSAVAKTGIATSRKRKDKLTGENKEDVMFIDLVFYGRGAEIANQYLTKGKKIAVDGRLVFEQWTNQEGQKQSRHTIAVDEFEMLSSKQEEEIPKKAIEHSYDSGISKEIDIADSIPF